MKLAENSRSVAERYKTMHVARASSVYYHGLPSFTVLVVLRIHLGSL